MRFTLLNAATKQRLTRSSKCQSQKRALMAKLTKVARFSDCIIEKFELLHLSNQDRLYKDLMSLFEIPVNLLFSMINS